MSQKPDGDVATVGNGKGNTSQEDGVGSLGEKSAGRGRHMSSGGPRIRTPSQVSQDLVDCCPVPCSRVLVLYTGGTIGMKTKNGVYVPEPNFLVSELKQLSLFHDSGFPYRLTVGETEQLSLPFIKEPKRIVYTVKEYYPLIDSSNMTYDDYFKLAQDIYDNYRIFDGFVILHGTDTMSYTAAALSFMLENLGKPVILTGSQIPIFELRSDGRRNFLNALILAGNYSIPEVTILFNSVLLRGNRSTKVDCGGFDAFESPNMEPLVKIEIQIKVMQEAIFRHKGLKKFNINTKMCPNVGVLRLFPGISSSTVKAFLQAPMRGVVLQTYGEGNGPTARRDIMDILYEATHKRGVIIVNTSQCPRGSVAPGYAAGKELQDVGVILGYDMTVEASLMKLSYVLGQDQLSLDEKKKMMATNLRGELTITRREHVKQIQFSLIENIASIMMLSSSEESQLLREVVFPYLLCAAARDGSISALNRLEEAGAIYSMADYDGRTALHIACCEGKTEVVEHLLEAGAAVHLRDRYGDSPLDNAVMFRKLNVIPMLRQAGAQLYTAPGKQAADMCNAIYFEEDDTAVRAWQLAGADFNVCNVEGRSPLHVAACAGKVDIVRFLLQHGADPWIVDSREYTPLGDLTEWFQDGATGQLRNPSRKIGGNDWRRSGSFGRVAVDAGNGSGSICGSNGSMLGNGGTNCSISDSVGNDVCLGNHSNESNIMDISGTSAYDTSKLNSSTTGSNNGKDMNGSSNNKEPNTANKHEACNTIPVRESADKITERNYYEIMEILKAAMKTRNYNRRGRNAALNKGSSDEVFLDDLKITN